MDKNENAKRLLRAMSNVDDKYIQEAMDTSSAPAKSAVTTSLRRYTPFIGIAAAALLLLIVGSAVMRIMHSNSAATATAKTADEAVAAEAAADGGGARDHNSVTEEIYSYSDANLDSDTSGYALPTEAADEGLSIEEDPELINPMTEADTLADLADMAGFDIQVPDSVEGSDSCRYFFYDADGGLAEVRYLDEDGNVICTIRKAPGEGDISGLYECYSVTHKIEVEGSGTVDISGNGQEYGAARWTSGDYAYSIVMDDMISQEAILDLVSQVS